MFPFALPLIPVIIGVIEEVILSIAATVITINLLDQTVYYFAGPKFLSDPSEMDRTLGKGHSNIPDEPGKPGRNKKVWRLNYDYEIVQEAHPYDSGTEWTHRSTHWHINTPDGRHLRYLSGDIIPDWVFNFLK